MTDTSRINNANPNSFLGLAGVKFRCVVCREDCVAVDYLEFGDKVLLVCPRGHRQFVPKNLIHIQR
jgi:hypothetical protein